MTLPRLPLFLGLSGLLLGAPALALEPAALCEGRAGCEVAAVTEAGSTADAQAIRVAELRFQTPPPSSWAEGLDCREGWREFHALIGEGSELLLELCNDGYGASGVGEDEIEIGDNRLVHSQWGGSAWRWGQTLTYSISPFLVLQEVSTGFWALGMNYDQAAWDWTDWSQGRVEWWSPACLPSGELPEEDEEPGADRVYRSVLIPLLGPGLLPADAVGATLDSCAATITAEAEEGYVIHGSAAEAQADGVWMKVLAADPDLLFVTLRTGEIRSGGKTWLSDDHLEIWQAPLIGFSDHCIPQDTPARQWAVRLSDGAVFAAAGEPQALPEVLAQETRPDGQGGVIVSMTLRLAEPADNLSVVFSKGDGAGKQRYLLSSSKLTFGKVETIGQAYPIRAEAEVACVLGPDGLAVDGEGRSPEPQH